MRMRPMKKRWIILIVLALSLAANCFGQITISILRPAATELSGSDLQMLVTTQSSFSLNSVSAQVENRSITLQFSSCAYQNFGC